MGHFGTIFFEDACLGPREWDIGFLSEPELAAFEPLNRDALVELGCLRSLCVSVWCWALADIPEKREAAEYHLGYLRERAYAGQLPCAHPRRYVRSAFISTEPASAGIEDNPWDGHEAD